MKAWKELLGLALFIGTVSCQAGFSHTNMLSSRGSQVFQPHFGPGFGTGMTSFGTQGRTPFTAGSGLGEVGTGSHTVQTGVSHQDPPELRRILGSSIHGRPLRMGEFGLPRHGGAGAGERYASGTNNGWDGNPQTLGNQFRNSWTDPFRGGPIPPSFFRHGMMG